MPKPDGGPVNSLPSTPYQIVRYRILLGVLYLATIVVGCPVLAWLLPFPEIPLVKDKIEYLTRHGNEYDVLFIGSSRIHGGVSPGIFDRVAAENGVPVKSFNAGINGMVSPENAYVIEQILRLPHRRLRWIVVELTQETGLVREDTTRFGYWHDTPRLVLVARHLCGKAIEAEERMRTNPTATFLDRCKIWSATVDLICGHARGWLTRAFNLGRSAESLTARLSASGRDYIPAHDLGKRHDGWMPPMNRSGGPMTGSNLEHYQKTYADRLAQPASKERGDLVSQDALANLLSTISKSGVTPLLVVPPTTADRNFYPTAAREQELVIFDFSNVREYPELYVPEHRLDVDHLNTAGAEIFSSLLARRFAEVARQR